MYERKNVIEDLENRSLEFSIVREFLTNLKQEFKNINNKLVKIIELKKVEQESKISEYCQEKWY